METLLLRLNPLMEKATGLKLYPNYSYCRVYKKGDILKRHIDRFSCEISTTMNLGGNEWPIFLLINKKEVKVNLKPGDMLIYRGEELEHWREPFKGKDCAQVFFHYNNKKTKDAKLNMFDKKPHIGLPFWFRGRK
jgi:alkylated DNA repair dioxygenase AlkB